MIDIEKTADNADMIINGYAYIQNGDEIQVLNLNNPNKAVVLNKTGEVMETNMDDIEIDIVKSYFDNNRNLMED